MDRLHNPHAAGCVVFTSCDGHLCVLIILDQYGKWTFPKGHLEPGERAPDAAIREVFEETGITGQLGAFIDTIHYDVINKRGEIVRKQVDFFVMTTSQTILTLQADEGIHAYQWLSPAVAVNLIGYAQHKAILIKAVQIHDQA
ncbi:MAG: NUDIX hydrolase [Roseiflexaceae bacterium]